MSVARASALLILLLSPLAALADCRATVNGTAVVIAEGVLDDVDSPGWRERLLSLPRATWDRAWGTPPPCDSATLLTFMTAIEALPPERAAKLCLAGDGNDGWVLVPGERNFRGRCTRTVCERVNIAADGVADTVAAILSLREGEIPGLETDALSDGSLRATGTEFVIRRLMSGALDAGGSAILDQPLALGAAAVTVVVGGGALYLCQ